MPKKKKISSKKGEKKDKQWNEFLALSLIVLLLLSSAILLWNWGLGKCRPVRTEKKISQASPVYWTYSTPDGFSVEYPSEWQRLSEGLEPGFLLAAVDRSGAQIGVIRDSLEEGKNLGQMLEERVDNFSKLGLVVILGKDIGEEKGFIEFTVGLSNKPLHSLVRAVLIKEANVVYVVIASAPVSEFNKYQGIIDHVINSVKTL
jgi:hypothetical protein